MPRLSNKSTIQMNNKIFVKNEIPENIEVFLSLKFISERIVNTTTFGKKQFAF
jgi:hypothetical protein